MAASRDEARAIWRDHWPVREGRMLLLREDDTRTDIPAYDPVLGISGEDDAFMRSLYRQVNGHLRAELAGFDTKESLEKFMAILRQEGDAETERRLERFREGMRKMDADPAERERVERLAAEALRDLEDEG
jgi:hypothetical protein